MIKHYTDKNDGGGNKAKKLRKIMKKGKCESFDKKPRNHLEKSMKGDNTDFSQKHKMNKVVYEPSPQKHPFSIFPPPPPGWSWFPAPPPVGVGGVVVDGWECWLMES